MEKYRSLPFAMYDLAVYLPGGAVVLVLLKAALESILEQKLQIFSGSLAEKPIDAIDLIIRSVLWLSASYLTGHLASFLSTYLVEKPVHHYLGYPSAVWLEFENSAQIGSISESVRTIISDNISKSFAISRKDIVQWIVLIGQIPALPIFLAIKSRGSYGFYSPKLPLGILGDVKRKYNLIKVKIKIDKGTRWEKIVEHYVSNNCPIAYTRMYNYLVIYGALRLLALILLMISWYFIAISVFCLISAPYEFDPYRFSFVIMSASSYSFAVMAFAKFNRRYFEETIMALLLTKQT